MMYSSYLLLKVISVVVGAAVRFDQLEPLYVKLELISAALVRTATHKLLTSTSLIDRPEPEL